MRAGVDVTGDSGDLRMIEMAYRSPPNLAAQAIVRRHGCPAPRRARDPRRSDRRHGARCSGSPAKKKAHQRVSAGLPVVSRARKCQASRQAAACGARRQEWTQTRRTPTLEARHKCDIELIQRLARGGTPSTACRLQKLRVVAVAKPSSRYGSRLGKHCAVGHCASFSE